MTQPGIIQSNRETILQRVAEGDQVGQIAKDLGIDRRTIARNLASDPEYQDALLAYHASRLDQAEALLLDAATHNDVPSRAARAASAGQLWRAYSWRAERTLSSVYGSKQEITSTNVTVDIAALLDQRERRISDAARVIEQEG